MVTTFKLSNQLCVKKIAEETKMNGQVKEQMPFLTSVVMLTWTPPTVSTELSKLHLLQMNP